MANLKGIEKITPKVLKEFERRGYNLSSIIAQAEKKDIPVGAKAYTAAATQTQAMQQAAQDRATAAANPGTQATFTQTSWGQPVVTYTPTSSSSQASSSSSSSSSSSAPAAAAPPVDPLQGYVGFMDAQSANTLAIETLRDAGMTERQTLIKETAEGVQREENKGKLDLQKIVNAGYKNIANIERGSNMFASIMGAFNF